MKPTTIRTWFPMKIIFNRSNITINNMSFFGTCYIKIRITSIRISNNINPSTLSFNKILVFNSRSSFSNSKFFYIRSSGTLSLNNIILNRYSFVSLIKFRSNINIFTLRTCSNSTILTFISITTCLSKIIINIFSSTLWTTINIFLSIRLNRYSFTISGINKRNFIFANTQMISISNRSTGLINSNFKCLARIILLSIKNFTTSFAFSTIRSNGNTIWQILLNSYKIITSNNSTSIANRSFSCRFTINIILFIRLNIKNNILSSRRRS